MHIRYWEGQGVVKIYVVKLINDKLICNSQICRIYAQFQRTYHIAKKLLQKKFLHTLIGESLCTTIIMPIRPILSCNFIAFVTDKSEIEVIKEVSKHDSKMNIISSTFHAYFMRFSTHFESTFQLWINFQDIIINIIWFLCQHIQHTILQLSFSMSDSR